MLYCRVGLLGRTHVRNISELNTFLPPCPFPSLGILFSAVSHSLSLNSLGKLKTFKSSLPWENALWDINFKLTFVARFGFVLGVCFLFIFFGWLVFCLLLVLFVFPLDLWCSEELQELVLLQLPRFHHFSVASWESVALVSSWLLGEHLLCDTCG